MTSVGATAAPQWTTRLLVVGIVATLAASGGLVAAESLPDDVADAAPAPALTPAAPDLDPIGRAGATLVDHLSADLPVPQPVPGDPYAPTPEVRHGMLEIPAIGLAQPLFEGVTLTSINRGPSHWPGTALPGALGNVVVAGHRTTYFRPFLDLDLLKPGDVLIFTMADGARHVYALDRTEIVDDSAIHIVDQPYALRATLFACHPKGSARQRIVGHFSLVGSSLT